jgi:nucleotide-binding universal stress UspA family protein
MLEQAPRTKLRTFDRIVCGIDESNAALEAARQAERLRDPLGSLHLAAVVEVSTAAHAGWAMGHVLVELNHAARAALDEARQTVHPATTAFTAGEPVRLLLDAIKEHNATLVAVGSGGHRRAVGIMLGTVGTRLLHEASCSVLIARQPQAEWLFPSSIVAGVDGSPSSLAAVDVAQSVAERFDAELVVVAATGGKEVDLEGIARLTAPVVLDPRKPVEALADLAQEADLLVVGSRGLHGPRALGSVSERVGHRAPCSVLVVR